MAICVRLHHTALRLCALLVHQSFIDSEEDLDLYPFHPVLGFNELFLSRESLLPGE